jgi:hypothetical protein
MGICAHSSIDTPGLYFEPSGIHCERPGIHVSVYGPLGLYNEPPKLMNFDFNADPDPAFHTNGDPNPQPCI